MLAAGGIGSGAQIAAALALGCQGAWSGSQWLMVEESENTPVQQDTYVKASSRDTVRSRSFTGKPCRMLRNDWTEAWEAPGSPEPLGMPLQYMVSGIAVAATHRYPDQTVDVAFNPVGQVVGQFERVEKTAAVIERWVNEYLEATEHLDQLNAAAGGGPALVGGGRPPPPPPPPFLSPRSFGGRPFRGPRGSRRPPCACRSPRSST